MIVPIINKKPIIPTGLLFSTIRYTDTDTHAEIIFTREQERLYTLTRFQFEAELEERNLHDAVMGMLEQLAQNDRKIELWLKHGTTVFRWSDKVIALAEALKSQGVDIDLDDFFEKAKEHNL